MRVASIDGEETTWRSGAAARIPTGGARSLFHRRRPVDAPFSGSGALSGGTVTFEPGARTAWHAQPIGQTLLVDRRPRPRAAGGRLIEAIRPGDIVWFEPRREALARGLGRQRDDTHRHRRDEGRRGRHLDGESHRRAIRRGRSDGREQARRRKPTATWLPRSPISATACCLASLGTARPLEARPSLITVASLVALYRTHELPATFGVRSPTSVTP